MDYKIAFLIGSESDRKIAEYSFPYFNYFNLKVELLVMSAHRNPSDVAEFASKARSNGYSLLICGAGMAAHLGGAVKANTTLPVIGVPLPGGMMDGLDSLLSTVQMPKGVPVATMSVGKSGAINAAIFCAEVLSLNNDELSSKLDEFKRNGATISD